VTSVPLLAPDLLFRSRASTLRTAGFPFSSASCVGGRSSGSGRLGYPCDFRSAGRLPSVVGVLAVTSVPSSGSGPPVPVSDAGLPWFTSVLPVLSIPASVSVSMHESPVVPGTSGDSLLTTPSGGQISVPRAVGRSLRPTSSADYRHRLPGWSKGGGPGTTYCRSQAA